MNNDSFKDYYKILQVDRNAIQEVITMAYKSLAKKYHPDLNLNNLDEANEKMRFINEAYNILNNVESRTRYNVTYDSYMKKNKINNDVDNDINNNVDNFNDCHMTERSKKEEYAKKRNIVIASIVAILFIYMVSEKILVGNYQARVDKFHRNISIKHKLR